MTRAAREVLEDCRGAVEEIGGGIQGSAWRRRWIAAVVLLRSVGYVLASVDSKASTKYARAIDAAWKDLGRTKPDPPIFWSFIDAERHNIVHEYVVGAGQGVTVYVAQNRQPDHHYVMNTGPFAGQDQRELLREAISWWEEYLDRIDKESQK